MLNEKSDVNLGGPKLETLEIQLKQKFAKKKLRNQIKKKNAKKIREKL